MLRVVPELPSGDCTGCIAASWEAVEMGGCSMARYMDCCATSASHGSRTVVIYDTPEAYAEYARRRTACRLGVHTDEPE